MDRRGGTGKRRDDGTGMTGVVGPEGMAGVGVEEDDKEGYGEGEEKKERVASSGRGFVVDGGSAEGEEHRERVRLVLMLRKRANPAEMDVWGELTSTSRSRARFYG